MNLKVKNIHLGLICLFALVSSGCVETSMRYLGNTVSPEYVIALEKHSLSPGTWETADINIDYEYTQKSGVLEITGQVALGEHQQAIYTYLKYLYVDLFFIDKDSLVLQTASLMNFLNSNTGEKQQFSRSYKVPAEAVGFSFGYAGEVYEVGDKTPLYFFKRPLSK